MRKEDVSQRGFVSILIIIFLIVVVGIVGYLIFMKRSPSQPSNFDLKQVTSQSTPKGQPDSCDLFSDSTFRSVNKYEVGLGPNGPAMGYWEITFKNGSLRWHHSDVTESGSYSCNDDVLQVKLFNRSITTNYDADRKILIWDGVEYREVE